MLDTNSLDVKVEEDDTDHLLLAPTPAEPETAYVDLAHRTDSSDSQEKGGSEVGADIAAPESTSEPLTKRSRH